MDRSGRAWPWASRREAIFDVALVVLLECLMVTLLWPLLREHGPAGLVLQAVLVLTLLFRRALALSVLLVMVLATLALAILGLLAPGVLASLLAPESPLVLLAVPFAAYSAVVYGADRRRAWLMIGVITLIATRPPVTSLTLVIGAIVMVVLPALLGNYVAGLNERAARAEREQHELAERARVEERLRLAAEMHDVVTHNVSLMVLQAGALGMTAPDAATRAASEELRAAGCHALEELRDFVGLLRSAPGATAEDVELPRAGGRPPVGDLAELVAESRSVGMDVEYETGGDPALSTPVVARTAYRVVQEALTNARKHAPGTRVTVGAHFGPDQVRLSVRNTAPTDRVDAALAGSGSGTGLLGLRERVELVSGTMRAGATADGGFEVDVVLPVRVPTSDEPAGPGPDPAATPPVAPAERSRGPR